METGLHPIDNENAFGVSSISREFTIHTAGQRPLEVDPLTPLAIVGIAISAFIAALIVGLAVDSVIRIFRVPATSESSPTIESRPQSKSFNRESKEGSGNFQCRSSGDRAYFFDSDKGLWSQRGLSMTGGASSIGSPLYFEVEDGCISLSPIALSGIPQTDISDALPQPLEK